MNDTVDPDPGDPPDPGSERVRESSEQHLSELFTRIQDRLRAAVEMQLSPALRRSVDADDIVQQTFLTAMTSVHQITEREERDVFLWLRRIAEHKIQDAARRQRARPHEREAARTERAAAVDPPAIDPLSGAIASARIIQGVLDRLAGAEAAHVAGACCTALKVEQREVILLRDGLQSSWKTVAFVMDLASPAAAKKAYARAREELAQRVGRRMDGEKRDG